MEEIFLSFQLLSLIIINLVEKEPRIEEKCIFSSEAIFYTRLLRPSVRLCVGYDS